MREFGKSHLTPYAGVRWNGPGAVRKRLETWTAAFPDLQWKLDRMFTEGNLVCAEFTFLGTHKGPLVGPDGNSIPPTNRPIELAAAGVYMIRDGKIAESRIYFDFGKLGETGR